LARLGG